MNREIYTCDVPDCGRVSCHYRRVLILGSFEKVWMGLCVGHLTDLEEHRLPPGIILGSGEQLHGAYSAYAKKGY